MNQSASKEAKKTGASRCAAVIVAGGTGTRMGREKQFLEIQGTPMALWSVEAFAGLGFDEIILVTTAENIKRHAGLWADRNVRAVESGGTRLESVRNGVKAVSRDIDIVAVHDGARPLVSRELILKCVGETEKYGACVPAVPVKDTLKVSLKGEFVHETADRAKYWAAQTPQCYRRGILVEALEKYCGEKDATDESQLVEKAGYKVRITPSGYDNIKVTTPEDLIAAQALMKNKQKISVDPKPAAAEQSRGSSGNIRVGFGYDIHRMVSGRPFVLGGIRLDHSKGLLGHSDGDVILHAACDAALGAAAAGEIGMFFPPTDLTIMGISSVVIAEKVLAVLDKKGVKLLQMDISVVAEEPKLKPHYPALRESVAGIFRLPLENVSVKAKSREGLGEIGRGEAVMCFAVVTVSMNKAG